MPATVNVPEAVSQPRGSEFALVAGITLAAAAFHALGQLQRPLWVDEACTYLIVKGTTLEILRGVGRADGSPPLYFLFVAAVTRVFGFGEVALRLPSTIAAVALVPAVYLLARRLAGWRTGVIAAALAAISPLVHYYSAEARYYALVHLETVAMMYATMLAVESNRPRWWALLALTQAIQLWTHGYGILLLPVPVVICLLVGGPSRVAMAAKAAAAAALAFALSLPWFLGSIEVARRGAVDWISRFWNETPPAAALLRSLEVFGFGGLYPSYLSYLGRVPSARMVSIIVSLALLVLAIAPWRDQPPLARARRVTIALLVFLAFPLVTAWLYSFVRQPLYLVGRYDTIALPAFLILLAIGLDKIVRVQPWAGAGAAAVILWLAVLSSSNSVGAEPFVSEENSLDLTTARHLARHASPSDPIVTLGFRRPVTAYYLDRAGRDHRMTSFPFEVADHPGWYGAAQMLSDPGRLTGEGQRLAQELVAAARQGRAVWILMSSFVDVDDYLYRALGPHMAIDEARSRRDVGILCLRAV